MVAYHGQSFHTIESVTEDTFLSIEIYPIEMIIVQRIGRRLKSPFKLFEIK